MNLDQIISVEFQLTEAEYFEAWTTRRQLSGVRYWIDRFVAVLLLIVGLYFFFSGGAIWFSVLLVGGATLFFLILFLAPLFLKTQFKSDPKFQDKQKLVFSETGIAYSTPQVNSNLSWDLYNQVIESDSYILLVYSRYQHSIIPKRSFTSSDQLSQFLVLAKKKLNR